MTVIDFHAAIGPVLSGLRAERGVSQEAAGRRAGANGAQVSKWERGQVVPDLVTLLPLLHAYGQKVMIVPALQANTSVERDRVLEAARGFFEDPRGDPENLYNSVSDLLEAEEKRK